MDNYNDMAELYKEIESEIALYDDYVSRNLISKTYELYNFINNAPKEVKEQISKLMLKFIDKKRPYISTWIYSFLIYLQPTSILMEQFEEYILFKTQWKANTKYFIFNQVLSLMFNYSILENKKNKSLFWDLLQETVNDFKKLVSINFKKISIKERNSELIIIITDQILGAGHSPTMVTLERCRILKQYLGKKVLLINTAETMSLLGEISFFMEGKANYNEDLTDKRSIIWKGVEIEYIQCENKMPSKDTLELLLSYIQQVKPYFILSLGGTSILANLANMIIPVLVEDFSSRLAVTMADYQIAAYKMPEEDQELLQERQISINSIIRSQVMLSIPAQKKKITKAELGLPQDKFILITMGNRLDSEVTDEFAYVLENVLDDNTIMVFCGIFQGYEKFINKHFKLKEHTYYIGLTDDILAVLENCDLYINMIRKGGGTTGTAAIYKGVPVVCTSYGDVAGNVGEDFITNSYETMIDLIKRYKEDKKFYENQVIKGKERAKKVLNAEEIYASTIRDFEKKLFLQEEG